MKKILYEVNRSQMNAKNKRGDNYVPWNRQRGRNRYERRVHSKLGTSVNQLNRLDMNKLFKDDILDVNLEVHGETDDYIVRISFSGFLKELRQQLKQTNNELNLRCITRALVKAFNSENVYVRCTCPDFQFRQAFWLSKNDAIAGEKEDRPSNITNPNDTKGSGCKHIAIALANTSWLIRTGNVIRNYINYMEKYYAQLYATVIYPALYDKPYEEPYQQDLFNTDDLTTNSDDDIVSTANKWASTRGQFQKGNEYRFRPSENIKGQQEFDFDSLYDELEDELQDEPD